MIVWVIIRLSDLIVWKKKLYELFTTIFFLFLLKLIKIVKMRTYQKNCVRGFSLFQISLKTANEKSFIKFVSLYTEN